MAVSTPINQAALSSISLEQLLAINPDWLIVAHYRPQSIVRDWQLDPLWQMLTTAQNNQVAVVDSNSWARIRGIFAAEHIALDLVAILHHRPVPGTIMSGRPLIAWRAACHVGWDLLAVTVQFVASADRFLASYLRATAGQS